MKGRLDTYVLIGRLAVPEPVFVKWSMWMGTHAEDCRVGYDKLGSIEVSTMFIGTDMSHGRGGGLLPVLFETMIFDPDEDRPWTARYCDWDAAAKGHETSVNAV